MSVPLRNRLGLVEVLAFSAASAFHKKVNNFTWMQWNVRFRGSGFSLLSYVRGGPYPEQDVITAQAQALLFRQILSLLISITYKTSLMVSQTSVYLWKECGFQIFLSTYLFRRPTEISNVISTQPCAFFLQIPSSPLTLLLWKEIMTFWTKISWNPCAGNQMNDSTISLPQITPCPKEVKLCDCKDNARDLFLFKILSFSLPKMHEKYWMCLFPICRCQTVLRIQSSTGGSTSVPCRARLLVYFFKPRWKQHFSYHSNHSYHPEREAGGAWGLPRTAQYTVTLNNPKATNLNSKLATG